MGTPHQGGSGVQLGRLLVNIASVFVAADDRIVKHLERDSEWLQQQLGQYGPISGDFVTKFAFEEYETPTMLGHSIMVMLSPTRTHTVTVTNNTGGATSLGRCPWSSRRGADRHPRGSHQHGKIRVQRGQWVQNNIGSFADYGSECKQDYQLAMGRGEEGQCG